MSSIFTAKCEEDMSIACTDHAQTSKTFRSPSASVLKLTSARMKIVLRPPGRNWAGLAPPSGVHCTNIAKAMSTSGSREGCAWDRSSQLRCLPLAILPQTRRQNPAPSKNGGVHFAQNPCETYTAIFAGTHTLPVRYRQSDPVPTCIHHTVVGKVSGLRWRKTSNEYLRMNLKTI